MDSKKIRKSISRFLAWAGLLVCSFIIKFFPSPCVYGFASNLAAIGYILARRQRKIALDSLGIAFSKEKTKQEIEDIARDCFRSMSKSAVEMMFMMDRPQLIRRRVEIAGRENLDGAIYRGKGVILVSAHFGNFPLMLARLALEGYPTGAITRPMRDSKVDKFFMAKRREINVKTILSQPRKECVENTIKALRNNELVFIPLDQNFGTAGVFVDFFGTKAATATGPVILAERTNAAIIPCFILRKPDDSHKIIFEPSVVLEKGRNPQETITVNIQKITAIIESYIRKYPAHWGWIHRRWKSRPNQ